MTFFLYFPWKAEGLYKLVRFEGWEGWWVSDGVAAVVSELSGGLAVADQANEFSGGNGNGVRRPGRPFALSLSLSQDFMHLRVVRCLSAITTPPLAKREKEHNTVIVVSFTIIAHRFSFKTTL